MYAKTLFQPGADAGLVYDQRPEYIVKPARAAKVRQIAACDDDTANRLVTRRIEPRWRWPTAPLVFQIASPLVVLTNAQYQQNGVRVGGRFLLSGAAGNRVWNRFATKDDQFDQQAEADLVEALKSDARVLSRHPGDPVPPDLPFAVDFRNGYNFYHFITEGMPQLAVIARADSKAPIHIHLPKLADLRGFITGFIETIYPQLKDRIEFMQGRVNYDAVRAVYQHRHYLYQVDDPQVRAQIAKAPADDPWHNLSAMPVSRGFVVKNSFDDGQAMLAADVREKVTASARMEWPERILILRDTQNGARSRHDERSKEFQGAMSDLGFETIYLERLSPIDQMALWSQAKIIVSPHGAAFGHMFFASPDTEVIEIGTPQTQRHRWGDFLQNAHVSRCRYTTIYSDVSRAGLGAEAVDVIAPPIGDGLLGIRFTDGTVEAIAARLAATEDAA